MHKHNERYERSAALTHGFNAVVKREENKVGEFLVHLDVVRVWHNGLSQ
ncbi:MAG TPA: hypothetical protein VMF08_19600 [Candidatus Sulfotelmatobacter sp.]|nr:hypothetical protein [Candidatus Sulfotelmatobacter sp.]